MQTTTDNGETETGTGIAMQQVSELTDRQVYDRLQEERDELTTDLRQQLDTLCMNSGCSECMVTRRDILERFLREPEEVDDTVTNLDDPTADGGGPDFSETEGMTLVEVERVSTLERQVGNQRDTIDQQSTRIEELLAQVQAVAAERDELQSKQDNFVEVLHGEADSRGWCSEYDDIMERVGLPRRTRYYTAYVSVTLTFQTDRFLARDQEAAEATITDAYVTNHLRRRASNIGYGGREYPQIDDWEIENVEEMDE